MGGGVDAAGHTAYDGHSKGGQVVASWDPHTHPVITELDGRLSFTDILDGVTVEARTDEVTGLSSLVVMDPKQRPTAGKDLRPMISLLDAEGIERCRVEMLGEVP